jgi:hypothetical protein
MALQKLHIAYVSWILVVVFFFKKDRNISIFPLCREMIMACLAWNPP